MSKSEYCIGVDLGGANIAVGLVRLDTKSIVRQFSVKTHAPRPCESIAKDILDVSQRLCRQEGIELSRLLWIGVAAPGIVKDDVIVTAFNLSWENAELGKVLSSLSGLPTYVANDANAAAYAEALWGSGAGCRSLVALTLGTGVGGGIVLDGKIWEGINGFAAEMGHTTLFPEGRECVCGKRGCLEAYCSAPAIIKQTRRLMELHPESSMWHHVNANERISGKTPFIAMLEGDEAAKLVVDDFIESLSIAVVNLINIFQPDVLCIGGGISREGDNILIPLRERVERNSFGKEGKRTKVVAATYRNDAGIIGAALLGLHGGRND